MYEDAFRKAINEEIKKNKPDIIHAGHIWILSSIAADTGIKTIITAHGTDIIGHQKDTKFHSYTNNAVDKCDKIITISNDNKKLVETLFDIEEERVCLMKNGYNPEKFYIDENAKKEEILARFNIENKYEKIVCFAGKLTKIKGIDTLLKANKLYDDGKTLTLISGNGELFNELNSLKDELGLKNTYFLGNQTHDTLRDIYNIADVSIVPSRVEAFGLVAVEALACGTPVIASNQGGLPEIINDEVGMIFTVDNEKELAADILKVFNTKYDAKKLNKYVFDKYSQESLIDDLIDLYQNDEIEKVHIK
jgi:glycosyltransferase involved in cell wall biosynthesis